MKNPEDKFAMGCDSMARNCQAAIECIRQGKMTLEGMDKWLTACIENDAQYRPAPLKAPEDPYGLDRAARMYEAERLEIPL